MGVVSFFAVLVGTVAGTYWATVAPVLAEIIDLKDLPCGLSITWLVLVPPTTVAEPIALLLRDNNSINRVYLHVQIFTGLMYIAAAVCLWIVRGWKVGDNIRAKQEQSVTALNTDKNGQGVVLQQHSSETGNNRNVEGHPQLSTKTAIWLPHTLIRRMVAANKV